MTSHLHCYWTIGYWTIDCDLISIFHVSLPYFYCDFFCTVTHCQAGVFVGEFLVRSICDIFSLTSRSICVNSQESVHVPTCLQNAAGATYLLLPGNAAFARWSIFTLMRLQITSSVRLYKTSCASHLSPDSFAGIAADVMCTSRCLVHDPRMF